MARVVSPNRVLSVPVSVPSDFYREEFIRHRECLAQQREYFSERAISDADEALALVLGRLEQLCAAQVPGDTYRNLVIHPVYSNQTFKHVLVPVWLLTYDYGAKKYQVVANGYTGVIAGQRPYSAWKIFFLVVAILIVVLVLAYASQS